MAQKRAVRRALAGLLLAFPGAAPALAQEAAGEGLAAAPRPTALEERLISALSDEEITIQTLYSGSELLVFGAVERNRFLSERDGPLDVAI